MRALKRRLTTLASAIAAAALLVLATASPAAAIDVKYIFQPSTSAAPLGYTPDTGQAYSAALGRGWVTESSLSSPTHTPVDLTSWPRQRDLVPSPLNDRFIHMHPTVGSTTQLRAAFEVDVPNGTYDIAVQAGDPLYFNSVYTVRAEGQAIISGYVPSKTAYNVQRAGRVTVTDGKLTIDGIGGTNVKLNWLTIVDAPIDNQPPVVPPNFASSPSTDSAVLSWGAGTDPDLSGYDLYRTTTPPGAGAPTTQPINATRIPAASTGYTDGNLTPNTDYYYVLSAIDTTGNRSYTDPLLVHTAALPAGAVAQKVSFQPAGPAPQGYSAETGGAYDSARGMGFVTEASLATANHVPQVVTDRTRKRDIPGLDQRLDSFVHLALNTPTVAWEMKVPPGDYHVVVAAGDPSYFNSKYVVNVEGKKTIDFTPTTSVRSVLGTADVRVTDGRLTIDGIGGNNVKLQYIDVTGTTDGPDTTPPAAPIGLTAISSDAAITIDWADNTEADLAGYDLYRSTTSTIDTTGTPLNGTTLLANSVYADSTATPGTTYYYAAVARDTSGNKSAASTSVHETIPVPVFQRKINFQPADAPTVSGWTVDSGGAFNDTRGFGWVREDSLNKAAHVSYDFSTWPRDRNKTSDQLYDTFMQMQPTSGDRTKGAWEAAVPNGAYDVSVGVGDGAYFDSSHVINVEGQRAIAPFSPTAALPYNFGVATVLVNDGRLTIDAIGGQNTKISWVRLQAASSNARPAIGAVNPSDGSTLIARGRAVTAEVVLPTVGAGVDKGSLTPQSVHIERRSDGAIVPANLNTSGGGDVVVLQPTVTLDANTTYRFVVTNALKDTSDASFIPKLTTFTTGSATGATTTDVKFKQEPQSAGAGEFFGSLAIGPDDKLYATTLDGKILRFPRNADGSLGTPTVITTIADHEGQPRNVIGIAFDPASTATDPILWVSHGSAAYVDAPDWSGKISRLSGPDLTNIVDYVTNLPRSVRDHQTNSLAFGPDGALYVTQGSQSAMGAPDNAWGQRPEHLLNAAVLRLDTAAVTAPPLDVKTDSGGSYNPFAPGAPLTLYATGVRNAFDLVFHSNGELYSAVNGSAAGGNTPATASPLPSSCASRIDFSTAGNWAGPSVPATNAVPSQPDILAHIRKGKYYGHPNPTRCEWTFFGGNPTSGVDPLENPLYPVGTQPDRNFVRSFDLGQHYSPNGMVEYRSSRWSGELDHTLLVARYSAGDDLVALKIDPTTKEVTSQVEGIPGFTGLTDPLDVTTDPANGNVYVSELGAARITLLKPDETPGAPNASITPASAKINATVGSTSTVPVTVRNTGNAETIITNVDITGSGADAFTKTGLPILPVSVRAGESLTFNVQFAPTAQGVKAATAVVTTNDPAHTTLTASVRGVGHVGEPSLQRIADLYDTQINIGDDDPNTAALPSGARIGSEVTLQTMSKAAGVSKVSVEPIAAFGTAPTGATFAKLGWHGANDATDLHGLASIPTSQNGKVAPDSSGALSFNPGTQPFGLHVTFPAFGTRTRSTENALNMIGNTPSHQVRSWELRDNTGALVPNAYLVAFEEDPATTTAGMDFNDTVVIVRGVEAEESGAGRGKLSTVDPGLFPDRLMMNRIGTLASPPAGSTVHDQATVRVKNTGTSALAITGANITGPFTLVSPTTFPVSVAPGATQNVTVKFIAESGRVRSGALSITTDSLTTPTLPVELAGYWQSVPEGGQEPNVAEVVNGLLGSPTVIVGPGQRMNNAGHVEAIGDEVLAPYWRVVDSDAPVKTTQIAAFHGVNSTADLRWLMRGGNRSVNARRVVQHNAADAQSVFPRASSGAAYTTATFTPPASFTFGVGTTEWMDPKLNDHTTDVSNGCAEPCGHHFRAWPLKERDGTPIANTYVIAQDYAGINYDYQDNIYIVSNVAPDDNSRHVIARIDAASSTNYTDTRGQTWTPDTGLFTPTQTLAEGAVADQITNTDDDRMYATYRGNSNTNDQSQRFLNYTIPTGTATNVEVRLYYAERFFSAAGQRVFSVQAEGATRISNLDLFSVSGGKNVAWSSAITDVPVFGGDLDLRLVASVNYPALSGFEVICNAGCSAD